jgi:hypothetical protein
MYRFFIFISWVISFVCFNRLVQTDNHCVQQFYAGLGLIFLISFPALFKHLAGKRTEVTLGGKTVKNWEISVGSGILAILMMYFERFLGLCQ